MEHTTILPVSAAVESAERFLPTEAGIAPLSAIARALSGFNRDQLGNAVEVLIALMDVADGEPDAEDATDAEDDFAVSPMAEHFATGPGCGIADSDTASWEEWHTRGNRKAYPLGLTFHEDDEEDDAAEDDDDDTAIDDGPCDEPYQDMEPDHDVEREQLPNDVPALPVFTAEHNIFTDRRTYLGMNAAVFIGRPVL